MKNPKIIEQKHPHHFHRRKLLSNDYALFAIYDSVGILVRPSFDHFFFIFLRGTKQYLKDGIPKCC